MFVARQVVLFSLLLGNQMGMRRAVVLFSGLWVVLVM